MTDRDLLHALRFDRADTSDTYAKLLDAYGDELYRRCILVLRDRDAAHVVLRDTLIVARAHIGRLRDTDRLREWLHALAEAECARHLAHHRVHGDARPLLLPERTDLVRERVLNGVSGPGLAGYRTHVAARAARFGRDGFPRLPVSGNLADGPVSPLSFVIAVLCALLVLALAGYALTRDPGRELGTDAPQIAGAS
ncbi:MULTISPECIES: sigma-70 family RNA polymerase sigma factor [unclassified Nocardiopsis]|uniref:RNA polymerase sigma factor n=1 Tax=unclassified Nocardiopsis TaxID=2649073 RepID=UPI00340B7065